MKLDFSQPQVMGILNVTPDSFSDGGCFSGLDAALHRVEEMLAEGVDIIDVGGESTRPGAQAVGLDEELRRVIPLLEAIRSRFDVPVSVDTSKPEVMRAAVAAGADMLNDVYALRHAGALECVASLDVPICLMHMQGEPRTMQTAPVYNDVVEDVISFLSARADACVAAGIARHQLLLDPGFGFGKTLSHNLELLRRLDELLVLGYPVLAGMSRKRMIGEVLDKPVDQRLFGGIALAALAVWQGARIIRVHDVAATVDAVKMIDAVKQG